MNVCMNYKDVSEGFDVIMIIMIIIMIMIMIIIMIKMRPLID